MTPSHRSETRHSRVRRLGWRGADLASPAPSPRCARYMEPYLYVAPAVLTLLAATLFPFLRAVVLSTQNFSLLRPLSTQFVGLDNYIRAMGDPRFLHSLKVTVLYTSVAVTVELLLGFGVASLVNREFVGKALFRTLFLLPMVISPVAVGLMWRIFFDADAGMVNYFLSFLGIRPRAWLASQSTALWAVVATEIWQWTPFMFLVLLAGLEALPNDPFEAARIDGASWWQVLWHVTLPLIRPVLGLAVLIRAVDAVRAFDLIYVMTSGGPGSATESANYYIYLNAFRFYHVGYASALALLLTMLTTLVSLAAVRRIEHWAG